MLANSFMQHAPNLSEYEKMLSNPYAMQILDTHLNPQQIPADLEIALKPLVAAVGGTLFAQMPNLKMYRQTKARLDLLDEITSYHLQRGTRDKSIFALIQAERDTVAEFYALLDINNTIDHRTTHHSLWNQYLKHNKAMDVEIKYNFTRLRAKQDDISKALVKGTQMVRRSYCMQRIQNGIRQAAENGWYIVFDTLSLSNDRMGDFYNNPNAIRDHLRNIGRSVNLAENKPAKSSYTDKFQYILVPEYGTKHGRLHFHAVYIMRTLPKHTVDPNLGLNNKTNQIIKTLHNTWEYGFNLPIAVRFRNDAYTRLGWFWPIDKKTGKPRTNGSAGAVGSYIGKYINKYTDQDIQLKKRDQKKWNNTMTSTLSNLPNRLFRVRMSRGFGTSTPPMNKLSTKTLTELTLLHWSTSPINRLLRQNAKRELRSRLATLTVANIQELLPPTINLLALLRLSTQKTANHNPLSFTAITPPKLKPTDISNETSEYLHLSKATPAQMQVRFKETGAPK